jgi:hypothetical protein
MGFGAKSGGDLKIGTSANEAAAGNKGVTNGDGHDHDGGDGATIPAAGTSGLIAAPVAPFALDMATILLDGGVPKGGYFDPCTGAAIQAEWAQRVGTGYTITPDGSSKYSFSHTHAAASNPRLSLSIPSRSFGVWLHIKRLAANNSYFLIGVDDGIVSKSLDVALERSGGQWKLRISENGDTTIANVAGVDEEGWLGLLHDPISGYLKAYWSNNAGGSTPGYAGSSTAWSGHTTDKRIQGSDIIGNPVVSVEFINTAGAGTEVCEAHDIGIIYL